MAKLTELTERCEQAAGPDRLLDANIHWRVKRSDFETDEDYRKASYCYARGGWTLNKADRIHLNTVGVPLYTASLDAAMTLVPEGMVEGYTRPFDDSVAAVCSAPDGSAFYAHAATPALALCAAALKAHDAALRARTHNTPDSERGES